MDRQEVRDPAGLGQVSRTVTRGERDEVTVRKGRGGEGGPVGDGSSAGCSDEEASVAFRGLSGARNQWLRGGLGNLLTLEEGILRA